MKETGDIKIKFVPAQLVEYNEGQIEGVPENYMIRTEQQEVELRKSVEELPEMTVARAAMVFPLNGKYVAIGGNGRVKAQKQLGKELIPVILLPQDTPVEKLRRMAMLDNDIKGTVDWDKVAREWDKSELKEWNVATPKGWANEFAGNGGGKTEKHNKLKDIFVVPPFSVLDTRQGYWNERKSVWRGIIGDKGESRENTLAAGDTNIMAGLNNGVSLFDPVLSELVCRWFTPNENARIFDCFVGDTQKGLVFGYCGHDFVGIELRDEQVQVNNKVLESFPEVSKRVSYICDDGQNVGKHFEEQSQDLLFSCPPYYDLEHYSELENDASNQSTYKEFLEILDKAFTGAIRCLKENRFAVIVVGDVRDAKTGFYYDFPGDIIRIFQRNGMPLYNEMILVETLGTLPQRVGRYMSMRKVGKCHQNILVFYKGDASKIKYHFPAIDYSEDDIKEFAQRMKADETLKGWSK